MEGHRAHFRSDGGLSERSGVHLRSRQGPIEDEFEEAGVE